MIDSSSQINMLKQQLRTNDINDERVLNILSVIKREDYVPANYIPFAYADMKIPLDNHSMMFTPLEEATIISQLITRTSAYHRKKALEIGTGSGYLTALLASFYDSVVTIDLNESMQNAAKFRHEKQGLFNINYHGEDGYNGWVADAPYDAIVFNVAIPDVSSSLLMQLSSNGLLFAITGDDTGMSGCLYIKTDNYVKKVFLMNTVVSKIHSSALKSDFIF